MKTKLLLTLEAMMVLAGAVIVTSRFYSGPDYYGPGFYYGAHPVVVGDYDDQHVWRDRYWWVSNRHAWVHEHHPDWIENETHEEHEAYEHHH